MKTDLIQLRHADAGLARRAGYAGYAGYALCICVLALAACDKNIDPLSQGATNPAATTTATTTIGTDLDDSVVTTKVKSALLADEYVKSLDIKVETYKGEVMLSGFATSTSQIERSVKLAQDVQGVKHVNNQLSLKTGLQTVGNKVDDSVITAKVKSVMLADSDLKSRDIAVVTRKGEVQLSGFVDNDQQIRHAIELAKTVDGVALVVDHMGVRK
jgi:hyperosmotically inducible protein